MWHLHGTTGENGLTHKLNVFFDDDLDENAEDGGPGQAINKYLPKAQDIQDKLRDTLDAGPMPDVPDGPAVAGPENRNWWEQPNARRGLETVEKKLDHDTWTFGHHSGSHFPLAVFTRNVSRRSPEAVRGRNKKKTWTGWKSFH